MLGGLVPGGLLERLEVEFGQVDLKCFGEGMAVHT